MTGSPFCQLADYAALEYILLGDLRDLLDDVHDEQNRYWLIAVLDALLDTLPREFGLKEEDGYLSDVVESCPNWSGEVDRLKAEHDILFRKLRQLRNRVDTRLPLDSIAGEVRNDLRDWIERLVAHNRQENQLQQMAVNLEMGCGD